MTGNAQQSIERTVIVAETKSPYTFADYEDFIHWQRVALKPIQRRFGFYVCDIP
jgi:hypothetical protein